MTANGTSDEYVVAELAHIADSLNRLAAVAQQPTEPQSSVEISRNAKGCAQWCVKVYASDAAGASELAQALYDDLAARYDQQPEASA